MKVDQLTKFTADALSSKHLSPGEDFWFEGADEKKVHGWVVKPSGFKKGEDKKWPVVLLIHGGLSCHIFVGTTLTFSTRAGGCLGRRVVDKVEPKQ